MIRLPVKGRIAVVTTLAVVLSVCALPAFATGIGFGEQRLEAGSAGPLAPDFLPAEEGDATALPGEERPRLGLLDSRRFSFSHSLSYGFSSGSYGSTSGGLWNTGITYRISDPLTVRADVAAWLNTSGEGSVLAPDHVFLRNLSLDYRIGESTSLHVSYRSHPAGSWGSVYDPLRPRGRVAP